MLVGAMGDCYGLLSARHAPILLWVVAMGGCYGWMLVGAMGGCYGWLSALHAPIFARVLYSTWRPCVLAAEWCVQSERTPIPDSRPMTLA